MITFENTPCDECRKMPWKQDECQGKAQRESTACKDTWEQGINDPISEEQDLITMLPPLEAFNEREMVKQVLGNSDFIRQIQEMQKDVNLQEEHLKRVMNFLAFSYVKGIEVGLHWYHDYLEKTADKDDGR